MDNSFGTSFRFVLAAAAAIVLSAFFNPTAHAAPVAGKDFTFSQPDGSKVQVRIWGDEYYQVVESLDGYTLTRDPSTGMICYASLSADGRSLESLGIPVQPAAPALLTVQPHLRISRESRDEQVEKARKRLISPRDYVQKLFGAAPAPPPAITGNVKGICLIVDFADDVATIPAGTVDNYCNQIGYTGYGNNGSVRDYFSAVSDGALTYTNFVPTAYYRALYSKSYYDNPTEANGPKARELILEALNALEAGGFDFSQYDSNGDNIVDGINCFYAGFCNSPWAKGLWPHASGVTFSADGVQTGGYQITDMGTSLELGTFCHENGHMIGSWPDLYDYDYDSMGVGSFCLMGYGGHGTNPVEPCAYMKYVASGWANVTTLVTPQTGLAAPSGVNTFYHYPKPGTANEFYLIENRQKTARDANLPTSGLAIWHCDRTGSNNWQEMLPDRHYKVTLVQADGLWDLEHDVNYGDSTDLWKAPTYTVCSPVTNPNTNWWDRSVSFLKIHGISTSAATMTFNFGLVGMGVSPTGKYQPFGPVGGPFTPSSTGYGLFNAGDTSINYTAAKTQPWLSLSSTFGALAPSATTTVTVSLGAAANSLAMGIYSDTVVFSNLDDGTTQGREVTLTVGTIKYYTELFSSNDNDLDYHTLTFTPDASPHFYSMTCTSAAAFPTDPTGGTVINTGDDGSILTNLGSGQTVKLYGTSYSSFYVGGNGYITFTAPDTGWTESFLEHFDLPRISLLFDDWQSDVAGTISWKQLADRAVVSYQNIREWGIANSSNFQVEMFFNGVIRLTYLDIAALDGLAGLSRGTGIPVNFVETDLTNPNAAVSDWELY
jgi:M6 family metalloprotease-like protein